MGRGLAAAVPFAPYPCRSACQSCSQTGTFGDDNGCLASPETSGCLYCHCLICCCHWARTKPLMHRQKLVLFTAPRLGHSLCDCQNREFKKEKTVTATLKVSKDKRQLFDRSLPGSRWDKEPKLSLSKHFPFIL